jgi:hypothetical protein
MANEIISHAEMCLRENSNLQKGMHFRPEQGHSVLLMSRRANAPYRDSVESDGSVLIYEGHDEVRSEDVPDPKAVDQPTITRTGRPTENGKFLKAALARNNDRPQPRTVRVYEKLLSGIWSYNGTFHLVDGWMENDGRRNVFKFRLIAVEDNDSSNAPPQVPQRRRIIPTAVKIEVWKRDHGQCVVCGARDELHFDHVLPYSKGGTSLTAANVQVLCARHNLEKHDSIS